MPSHKLLLACMYCAFARNVRDWHSALLRTSSLAVRSCSCMCCTDEWAAGSAALEAARSVLKCNTLIVYDSHLLAAR